MSNMIEHGGDDPSVVRVGGGEGGEISLKIYQQIYHQITGKTEEIRKRYKDAVQLSFEDIESLHQKIVQLFDIHNVVADSQQFTIFYEKERKESFTHFEKFRSFGSNSSSAVSNVVLKYKLSIVPAKLQHPQEYTLTIRLASRIGQLKELREDAPPFMHGSLAAMIASVTAEVVVSYADYVVARGFIEAFDEWIRGCKKTKENEFIKYAKKYSHCIPVLGKVLFAILYGLSFYFSVEKVFIDPNVMKLAQFIVFSGVAFFVVIVLSDLFLKAVERSIDSYSALSWITLTRGDDVALQLERSKQRGNICLFLCSSFMAIVLGVASSQISSFLDRIL